MRDHRLALLALRPFIRWKATSLARFFFDRPHDTTAEMADPAPSLTISPPRNFGVEIQMNVAPSGSATDGSATDAPLPGGASQLSELSADPRVSEAWPEGRNLVFHIPIFEASEMQVARGRTLASAASTSGTNMGYPGGASDAPEWEAQELLEPHASDWLCVRLPP